jgi:hypothetical protein
LAFEESILKTANKLHLQVLGACAAVALGGAALPAHGAVVYNFVGAPVIAQTTSTSSPSRGVVLTYPPASAVSPYGASLSFASPLANSTTTAINAEYGGFDLVGGPSQGGVLGFSASADVFGLGIFSQISSALGSYADSPVNGESRLLRYSTVQGSVTTDALGNISQWNLDFILSEVLNGSYYCTGTVAGCVPSVTTTSQDLVLSITSGAAAPRNLPYVALNGVVGNGSLDINFVDTAFVDPGSTQTRSFSGARGAWTTTNTPGEVPEPGTLALLLMGTLGIFGARKSAR